MEPPPCRHTRRICWRNRLGRTGDGGEQPDRAANRGSWHRDIAMKVSLSIMLLLAAAGAGPAAAQLPFGPTPLPESGLRQQCNKAYLKSLEAQVAALSKWRSAGPEFVGQICSMIDWGSALLGDELPDRTRQQIKGLLGFDIDLRFIKAQCRLGQGNLDRELRSQLGFLKSELARCNDTI
jgi:hypothetical protein